MIRMQLQLFGGNGTSMPRAKNSSNNKKGLQELSKMTDEELDAYFNKMVHYEGNDELIASIENDGLNKHSTLQRVVVDKNLNDKGVVLSDEDFDKYVAKNGGEVIYRGVDTFNSNITSEDITMSTMYGDKYYVGNGIYGGGLYFSNKHETAEGYSQNPFDKTSHTGAIMKATLNKNAKVIDFNDINEKVLLNDKFSHMTFNNDFYSVYALSKGYNAIRVNRARGTHIVALTRDALVFSESIEKR